MEAIGSVSAPVVFATSIMNQESVVVMVTGMRPPIQIHT